MDIVSSVVGAIQNIVTVLKYAKDVQNAPEDIARCLNELNLLKIYLGTIHNLITREQPPESDGPWLETLKQLFAPRVDAPDGLFKDLEELLAKLKKDLNNDPPRPRWLKRSKTRLLWTLTKTSVAEDLQKIERFKTLIFSATQVDASKLSDAIKNTVNDVKDILKNGEAEKVAEWLTTLDNNAVQQEKLRKRLGNTGNWFLESPEYKSWKDDSAKSRTLWCPGIPGVGKTILAAIIVEDLQHYRDRSDEKMLVLSVFCDYQVPATHTVAGLLCSLLKQLIKTLYDQSHSKSSHLPKDKLVETLSKELQSFDRVYIVLDALDEYNGNDGDRKGLINVVRDSLCTDTRLLVTSRDIGTTIGSLFEGGTRLDIRATVEDIGLYIESRFDSSDRLEGHIKRVGPSLKSDIRTGVTSKAKGMFLLAYMHVDSLAQMTTVQSLRNELKELPDDIWGAYDKTLKRIKDKGKEDESLALRVFGWIAFVERPLTVLELRHALAVEQDSTAALNIDNLCAEDTLLGVCVGLVVKDETYVSEDCQSDEPAILTFAHNTMQEYFHDRREGKLFPCIQETITRTCLSYMSFNDFGLSSDVDLDNVNSDNKNTHLHDNLAQDYPFLPYASLYWGNHACGQVELKMKDEIVTFLNDVDNLDRSAHRRKVASIFHTPSEVRIPKWFADHYGLSHIMKFLPKDEIDLGQHTKSSLRAASPLGGDAEAVKPKGLLQDQGSFSALLVTILTTLWDLGTFLFQLVLEWLLGSS
ncbi:hypothetical protein IW262DRAFT_1558972 [Armillaria fumosa]|nr:hypothetical protein IW262DRAFT_1558972 [Armillaria fumosa]